MAVDFRQRMVGRGAYVCPRNTCVADLQRRPGKLGRALRAPRVRLNLSALDGPAAAGGGCLWKHDLEQDPSCESQSRWRH